MTYENKPGSFVLFKNDFKQAEKHPDYKGTFYEGTEGGVVERDVAIWVRKSKGGKMFMSGQVSDKRTAPAKKEDPAKAEDPDDEIPF